MNLEQTIQQALDQAIGIIRAQLDKTGGEIIFDTVENLVDEDSGDLMTDIADFLPMVNEYQQDGYNELWVYKLTGHQWGCTVHVINESGGISALELLEINAGNVAKIADYITSLKTA